jgi:hypothetical protein
MISRSSYFGDCFSRYGVFSLRACRGALLSSLEGGNDPVHIVGADLRRFVIYDQTAACLSLKKGAQGREVRPEEILFDKKPDSRNLAKTKSDV